MSTVNKIEIPEEHILKQDIALPMLRFILAFNQKQNKFSFENNKLTVQFFYNLTVPGFDFNYYIETKYIFKNENDFDRGFRLCEFKIIDDNIVYQQDKYFILTWNQASTHLPVSSDFFEQVLQTNEIIALKVANEFFSKHDGTNTYSLIRQLEVKY